MKPISSCPKSAFPGAHPSRPVSCQPSANFRWTGCRSVNRRRLLLPLPCARLKTRARPRCHCQRAWGSHGACASRRPWAWFRTGFRSSPVRSAQRRAPVGVNLQFDGGHGDAGVGWQLEIGRWNAGGAMEPHRGDPNAFSYALAAWAANCTTPAAGLPRQGGNGLPGVPLLPAVDPNFTAGWK